MTSTKLQPYLNTRQNKPFRFFGAPSVTHAIGETTNGAFSLSEHLTLPVGLESPYHTHSREDESFYVLAGHVAFLCDGKWIDAGPGSFVFGPRGIPHGFRVEGDAPAQMLLLCAPAGFEHFMEELSEPLDSAPVPPDFGKVATAAARFGIEVHGPLPQRDQPAVNPSPDPRTATMRWIDAFNRRDWKAETACRTPDFRAHLSMIPQPFDGNTWAQFLAGFVESFPDSKITIDECVADGNNTIARWTMTGTHRGTFQGVPASGKAVAFAGMEWNRSVDGLIAVHYAQFDAVSLLSQIGALPQA
ncbi:MAG TPA: ester cyclase [Bryobacteraceae bacterium]|jgi:steroid delta-isomerase-like uncharacterized protein